MVIEPARPCEPHGAYVVACVLLSHTQASWETKQGPHSTLNPTQTPRRGSPNLPASPPACLLRPPARSGLGALDPGLRLRVVELGAGLLLVVADEAVRPRRL